MRKGPGINALTFHIGVGAAGFVSWERAPGQEGHSRHAWRGPEEGMPEASIDYYGPLASEGAVGVTILMARERRSRMTCAILVLR